MFDTVKQQVKEYLPDSLSPFATALVVGGITFILAGILLFFEIIRPGITSTLPELVMNMLIMSAATIMAGIVAWILQAHTKDKKNTKVLPRHKNKMKKVEAKKEKTDDYFNYKVSNVSVSYKMKSDTRAMFTDTRTYTPLSDVDKPVTLHFEPLMRGVKIRLVSMRGYKPSKGSVKELKRWRDMMALETNFKGVIGKHSEREASVTIEVKGDRVPDHVYCTTQHPVTGPIQVNVDVSYKKDHVQAAKLYEFVSFRAVRPIKSSNSAPIKEFNDGHLRWQIGNPKTGHLYVVTWKEPCDCSWCNTINFG